MTQEQRPTEPDGGDIASGFGDDTQPGPVSDERAQQMLHEQAEEPSSDGGAQK